MNLDDLLDKTFGKDKKDLHPPGVPIVGETSVDKSLSLNQVVEPLGDKSSAVREGTPSDTDSKPTIDDIYYVGLSKSSEFRRLEYLIRTGKTHRGTLKELDRDLMEFQKDIETIKELRKIDPNARNFGNVINEFENKVERLRKRNGN